MKMWYTSKTIWFNVITSVLMIATGLQAINIVPVQYLAVINLVGNVILRVWFTNTGIIQSAL